MKQDPEETLLSHAFVAEPSTNAERRALAQLRSSLARGDFAGSRPGRGRRLAFSTLVVAISAGLTAAAIVALRPNHPQPSKSPAAVPSATAQPTLPATPTVPAAPAVACAPTIGQLRMTSATDGWAVCQDGAQRSRVVTTNDGGRTVHDVSPQPLRTGSFQGGVSIAAATDPLHAWVMLPSSDPAGGAAPGGGLYRTSDGGRSWSHLDGFPWGGQISFTGLRTGFMYVWAGAAAGSSVVEIWRTGNGGATWDIVSKTDSTQPAAAVTFGVPLACEKNGAGWRDDTTGWVTGTCAGSPPVFLATHDGGVHWSSQALPLAPGADPGGGGFTTTPPVFSTPRDGTMIASGQSASGPTAFVYASHDGGASWTYTKAPADTRQVAVAAATDIAMTSDGSLFRSGDEGAHWVSVARHPELSATTLTSSQFVDADHGFFVVISNSGAQTTLYVTSDGGRTLERRQG